MEYKGMGIHRALPHRIYQCRKQLSRFGILFRRYGCFYRVAYLSPILDNKCPNHCRYCYIKERFSWMLSRNMLDRAISILNFNKPNGVFFGEKAEIGLNKALQKYYKYTRKKLDKDITMIITTKCPDIAKKFVKSKDNTLVLVSMTNPREIPNLEGRLVLPYSQREAHIEYLIDKNIRTSTRNVAFNLEDIRYFNQSLNIHGLDRKLSILSMLRIDRTQMKLLSKYIDIGSYDSVGGYWKGEYTITGKELQDIINLTINKDYIYDFRRESLMENIPKSRTIYYINSLNHCAFDKRRKCLKVATDSNQYKCNGYTQNKSKDIIMCPNYMRR